MMSSFALEGNEDQTQRNCSPDAHEDMYDNVNKLTNTIASEKSELVGLLKQNKLYDLYSILSANQIDLETLCLIRSNEVDEFCAAYQLTNFKIKLSFRKLMKIIDAKYRNNQHDKTTSNNSIHKDTQLIQFLNDNGIPLDIYDILISQHIGYTQLSTITSTDIDDLCNSYSNKITVGAKIRFRDAVKMFQNELKESENNEEQLQEIPLLPNGQIYGSLENINRKIKMVVVGDSGVGKTSFIHKYVRNKFTGNNLCTINPDLFMKEQPLHDGRIVKLEIWDTGGQERFHSMTRKYYRNADVILLCYKCGDIQSFDNMIKYWKTEIDEYASDDVILCIIGCQNDRRNTRELYVQLTTNTCEEDWCEYETSCWECSAKTGHNVKKIFQNAAEMVTNKMIKFNGMNTTQGNTYVLHESNHELGMKKKSSCCGD